MCHHESNITLFSPSVAGSVFVMEYMDPVSQDILHKQAALTALHANTRTRTGNTVTLSLLLNTPVVGLNTFKDRRITH